MVDSSKVNVSAIIYSAVSYGLLPTPQHVSGVSVEFSTICLNYVFNISIVCYRTS